MFKRQTFAQARDALLAEVRRLGASQLVLSTNAPLNRDGLPRGDLGRLKDPGVALYFTWRGAPRVLACDQYVRIEDNMRALELSIDAMRGLERWGASDMLNRAFTGFTALPAPEQWWDVLDVRPDCSLEVAEMNYRARIVGAHPDLGGSHDLASKLNWAIAEARRAKGRAA
jgi:hypothetical protein